MVKNILIKIGNKYKAKPVVIDGMRFASQKEGNRYIELKILRELGDVSYFLRQVPFHLPGNIKYICDFMVVYKNGEIIYEDVKGFKTPAYLLKKRIVQELYPITIKEI